jgi:GTP-binding protein HflX
VISAGGVPASLLIGSKGTPNPRYFVGTGKLEELKQLVYEHCANLVIFNHSLSPSQERNLESELECRVLDRTGLILDIFAQRALTHEGKLQVELAQLQHMSTRLVRGWTHLERQKGGIGLRGPGETQLETDRRLLRYRIKSILKRLAKVRSQRNQGRRSREKAQIPTISLVGYTNAGKSTLFNRLSKAGVYVADKLFATLDPTMRRIELDNLGPVILADTVGFISHLPHKLIEAFKATLEETKNAKLLLHVVDAASEMRKINIKHVNDVLSEIGAIGLPTLIIYNKIDLVDQFKERIDRDENGRPTSVWLSAQTGLGCGLLFQAISEILAKDMMSKKIRLNPSMGKLRSILYTNNAVLDEKLEENGDFLLEVKTPKANYKRILKEAKINSNQLSEEH